MSVKITTGSKKKVYPTIRQAAEAAGVPYMTFYMRIRKLGWNVAKAVRAEVRPYNRKAA